MEIKTFETIFESCNDDNIDDFTKLKEEVLEIRESIYSKLDQIDNILEKLGE